MEDSFDSFFAAKGAIKASKIFEIAAQGVFILVRQIHHFGVGFGEITLHPSENAYS